MARPATVAARGRRKPQQARAHATVERLLDATASELDARGMAQLTTNRVAERAGVNIATLYSYFPDKYALVAAFAERLDDRRNERMGDALAPGERSLGAIAEGLTDVVEFLLSEPGAGALVDALRTTPELARRAGRGNASMVPAVTAYVRRVRPDIAKSRCRRVAQVIVEASSGVASLCQDAAPRERKQLLREHARMLTAYLEA